MPVWLARIGLQLASDPDKLVKAIMIIMMLFVLIIVVVFIVPIMIFKHVPLGKSASDFNLYIETAKRIERETDVLINWQQVMAVDAVVLEQDFSKSSSSHVYNYKKYFIREVEVKVEQTCSRDVQREVDGEIETISESYDCSYYKTEYYARDWNEVLSMLVSDRIITRAKIEDVNRYLTIDLTALAMMVEGGGLSIEVRELEPIVRQYARQYGIEDKVPLLLALIQQESGGRIPDVMQSSESAGLPRNSYTNPVDSIAQGVKYFSQVLTTAGGEEKLALQAYNFGIGFIGFALPRGGYSKETAVAFSMLQANRLGWDSYGDVNYVEHVMRYYSPILASGEQIFSVNDVYQEMRNYLGVKYQLGARNPDRGYVDCSGLMEFVFAKFGINIRGTAQMQFDMTTPVAESAAQPGDLVFFYTGGDRTISHVGMYIGNDKFINANSKGVSESSVSGWKNYTDSNGVKYIFHGYRRITSK
ncbi:lysozyme family protein [Paenibacillus sp. GCM10012307]|uniref:Lysozyme family protein n=1 Tax=Paenibacillus roseus TaxID=2798579 RepID=A0A934J526_9BACL|nr:lysozyme family protein [Paenibacillus roseus]MBJ6360502.1 lysozyme family protein [Paenibacillus roseus]